MRRPRSFGGMTGAGVAHPALGGMPGTPWAAGGAAILLVASVEHSTRRARHLIVGGMAYLTEVSPTAQRTRSMLPRRDPGKGLECCRLWEIPGAPQRHGFTTPAQIQEARATSREHIGPDVRRGSRSPTPLGIG